MQCAVCSVKRAVCSVQWSNQTAVSDHSMGFSCCTRAIVSAIETSCFCFTIGLLLIYNTIIISLSFNLFLAPLNPLLENFAVVVTKEVDLFYGD